MIDTSTNKLYFILGVCVGVALATIIFGLVILL